METNMVARCYSGILQARVHVYDVIEVRAPDHVIELFWFSEVHFHCKMKTVTKTGLSKGLLFRTRDPTYTTHDDEDVNTAVLSVYPTVVVSRGELHIYFERRRICSARNMVS